MRNAEELELAVETFLSLDVLCDTFLEKITRLLNAYKKLLSVTFNDVIARENALSQAEWELGKIGKKYSEQCDQLFNMNREIKECSLTQPIPKPYASR